MGLGVEHERLRLLVLERDAWTCWCGAPATDADHIIPRALGGPTTMDNLVAACAYHNRSKGAELARRIKSEGPRHPFFSELARRTPVRRVLSLRTSGPWVSSFRRVGLRWRLSSYR